MTSDLESGSWSDIEDSLDDLKISATPSTPDYNMSKDIEVDDSPAKYTIKRIKELETTVRALQHRVEALESVQESSTKREDPPISGEEPPSVAKQSLRHGPSVLFPRRGVANAKFQFMKATSTLIFRQS
ncbi:uncharacterized protein N7515_006511 [Penicillium bovifimosum]|uniref:Uncharacterized protein n=1 Tax=Penicillium bovifimosum TaxID=126998 RepID=A0A9W9L1B3_9EURO|nr:uncharacterized protein N7515_006511 [Penicillium bovifimosum]KAJ5130472.1 hypothetical protein N7515_006511 [Penicillium bovifimosum]